MKSKILILFALLSMASCASVKSARVNFRSLDVETFAKFIEKDDVYLVDVRSATFFKDYQSLPKDKTIALYCKGGGRSKQVAGVLAGNGYKVVELAVGYDGWVKAGGKVDK